MENSNLQDLAIGVDVGGSHISSACVDLGTRQVIPGTYFYREIYSKSTKEKILKEWSEVINNTLSTMNNTNIRGIGFSVPGPFDYRTGTAFYEGNDKYEALYGVSVQSELSSYLNINRSCFRFTNDATAFAIGGALKNNVPKRVIAITLGTGFGAAFLEDGVPKDDAENIPEGGCLWDKPFGSGIADDYFSTRWFESKYEEYFKERIYGGVKEILAKKDPRVKIIFQEFAENFDEFIFPFFRKFEPELLVIGGGISKCSSLFLPDLRTRWKRRNFSIPISVLENTEEVSIIGASYAFEEKPGKNNFLPRED